MDIEKLVRMTDAPATNTEISKFEFEYGLTIPTQYKELLKLSNGADIYGTFMHPLHIEPVWKVTIYSRLASIEDLKSGFLMLKDINTDGVRYQHQDKILMIGGTQDGAHIMLGHDKPITGKVFIDDESEMTDQGEIALLFVANTFKEFLEMIEPLDDKRD